jgi:uncharacterized membrane protein YdjX (TVP38/TMEM64 family)
MMAPRRWWPAALVLAALGAAYALGLQRDLSFAALAHNRQMLEGFVTAHPAAAAAAFVALYVGVVAVSLPGSLVLTLTGGFLFGTVLGACCAVVGATLGAVLLFLAARHAVGDWLAARAGPFMAKLRAGLERDGFSYLLAIRLIPVVPFWLANLAPALAGMRLLPFALATLLGIIPATIVFASVGAGIGAVLQQGGTPDLSVVLRPAVLLPLLGLACLSLAPVAYRRWRAHG